MKFSMFPPLLVIAMHPKKLISPNQLAIRNRMFEIEYRTHRYRYLIQLARVCIIRNTHEVQIDKRALNLKRAAPPRRVLK